MSYFTKLELLHIQFRRLSARSCNVSKRKVNLWFDESLTICTANDQVLGIPILVLKRKVNPRTGVNLWVDESLLN